MEQATFAHFPLGKSFEKERKTIADQGEKQIKDNKKHLDHKKPGNNELLLSKEREIFKNIYTKRLDKIDELSKKMVMVTWSSLLKVVVYKLILVN